MPKGKKTFAVYTLGCRANQFDSESIAGQFVLQGFTRVPEFSNADIHLVNTCTVTNKGGSKSRHLIRKLIKQKNGGRVIVTGCSVQEDPAMVASLGADLVVDNANKPDFFKTAGMLSASGVVASDISRIRSLNDSPIIRFESRTRVHLKIQDGCSHFCTYCIIPFVRGRSRSLPAQKVTDQFLRYLNAGCREIVLTGIHMGSYIDQKIDFYGLLSLLLQTPGKYRIRLSAIEPGELDHRILELFKRYPRRLCRHLHIAVQSASDSVLKKMRRRYDRRFLDGLFSRLAEIDPLFGVGVDIITGFPGESDSDFQDTMEFIRGAHLNYGHVFRYSPKAGTAAESFPGKVPESEKKYRANAIQELLREKQRSHLLENSGTIQTAVFETSQTGTTGNFTRFRLISGLCVPGQMRPIRLGTEVTQDPSEKFPVLSAELA